MKVEATVDVGDNVMRMLEQLAHQIGTTADKVFPWYVQQAYLQGVTTAAAIAVALVLFSVLFLISVRRADFDNGNAWAPVCVVSGILLVGSILMAFIDGPQQIRKVMNPQFYAMTMLANDIGRMRTGRSTDSD